MRKRFVRVREFANSELPRDADTGDLYPYFSTGLKDFGKIGGPGVSLYFDFLKQASLVMASCFFFSLAFFLRNLHIVSSRAEEVSFSLRGSLVFPNGTDPGFGDFGTRWDANLMEAGVFLTFVFFAVSMGRHQKVLADEIDDIYSTAQDYTICVRRPPSACFSSPADVRDYFERSIRCKVVAVTLERDSSVLCRAREDFSIHLAKAARILRDEDRPSSEGALQRLLAELPEPGRCRRLLWSLCLCRDLPYHIWMMRQAKAVADAELSGMAEEGEGGGGGGGGGGRAWNGFALGRIPETEEKEAVVGGEERNGSSSPRASFSSEGERPPSSVPPRPQGSLIVGGGGAGRRRERGATGPSGAGVGAGIGAGAGAGFSAVGLGLGLGLTGPTGELRRSFDLVSRGGSTVMVSTSGSRPGFGFSSSSSGSGLGLGRGRGPSPSPSPNPNPNSNSNSNSKAGKNNKEMQRAERKRLLTGRFVRAFVTFQTEHQQRRALRYLRRGWCERMVAVDPVARCDTSEAPEPSDVIWDLGIRPWISVKLRSLGSWLATATAIAACFYVTSLLQALRIQNERSSFESPYSSPSGGTGGGGGGGGPPDRVELAADALSALLPGVAIAIINWLLPVVIMALASGLEKHESHSSRERSASLKLVIGRVSNTALVPFLATPGPSLVSEPFLQKILLLQLSNFAVSNLLRFLDPGTMWLRYAHGLFARTQADLEDLWVGGEWFVSERYSDVISIISIAAFFGPLIPASYAVAAATLCAAYWNDKYLLLRYWRRPPELDTSAASYASRFFVMTLVVHLLVASWVSANWPLTSIEARTLRWEVGVPEVDFSDKIFWRGGMGVLAVVLVVAAGVTFAVSVFVGAERCCARGAIEVFSGSAGASGKVGSRAFTKLRQRPNLYSPRFRVPGADYARICPDGAPLRPPPAWAGMETPAPWRTEVATFFKKS